MKHLVVRGEGGSGLPLERVASFTHCHPTIPVYTEEDDNIKVVKIKISLEKYLKR